MSLKKIYGWNRRPLVLQFLHEPGVANKTSRGCLLLRRFTHPPVRYRHLSLAVSRIERLSARSGKGAKKRLLAANSQFSRGGGGGHGFHLRSTACSISGPTLKACSGIQFQAHDPGDISKARKASVSLKHV
ncbi:hypothetical protein PgNI_06017 [Pyricularia grisea]|uniref:Uncharacterized protein n=1 Tax=Pyricularia grisea TaxID=148305 RepID=A0A6P8B6R7_PYRGI|nr:hypothetical protein PgNI_06017 [Pyricularia grisea]TLD10958.1 hypothetical protein PgNI_06017 [Pyricularia grisea]